MQLRNWNQDLQGQCKTTKQTTSMFGWTALWVFRDLPRMTSLEASHREAAVNLRSWKSFIYVVMAHDELPRPKDWQAHSVFYKPARSAILGVAVRFSEVFLGCVHQPKPPNLRNPSGCFPQGAFLSCLLLHGGLLWRASCHLDLSFSALAQAKISLSLDSAWCQQAHESSMRASVSLGIH